jgi:hypothetical protein
MAVFADQTRVSAVDDCAAARQLNFRRICTQFDFHHVVCADFQLEPHKAAAEPLSSVEKKLIGWSLGIGLVCWSFSSSSAILFRRPSRPEQWGRSVRFQLAKTS